MKWVVANEMGRGDSGGRRAESVDSGLVTARPDRHVHLSCSSHLHLTPAPSQHWLDQSREKKNRESQLRLQLPARLPSKRSHWHKAYQDKNLAASDILHWLLDLNTPSNRLSTRGFQTETVPRKWKKSQEIQTNCKQRGHSKLLQLRRSLHKQIEEIKWIFLLWNVNI